MEKVPTLLSFWVLCFFLLCLFSGLELALSLASSICGAVFFWFISGSSRPTGLAN